MPCPLELTRCPWPSCTGDLSVPWTKCKLFNSLTLPTRFSGVDADNSGFTEFQLPQHLLLSADDCGVIGRRVAITSLDSSQLCVAEGVIGFNTAPLMPSLQA
ncbi:hypothetical protein M406DRAFT_358623 [Cryphonectria parasitica EP155]|uniref:Uncharacterized protein n=1 Tax=Cryphonectria parasitica (strain ATCC 38755 / EP155) TaxID=660469 RepID=A0A9P5CI77_CRYP1|nr:uncharacterized protein M406DRAFT_358623 [Cryphonectria parasitica EP155]KAF3760383.1 hypothetical protein M406DRAFT_358623 [Cryphonectria parasitica EP155]